MKMVFPQFDAIKVLSAMNSLTELKVTSSPFYWFGFYGNDVGWIKEKDLRVHFETLYWNLVEQI